MKVILWMTLAGIVCVILCMTACSAPKGRSSLAANASEPTSDPSGPPVAGGEIRFDLGGALSKGLKNDATFRPFKLAFESGTNSAPVLLVRHGSVDEFRVAAGSSAATAILKSLNVQHPWDWQGLKATPFADGLYFTGVVAGNRWNYVFGVSGREAWKAFDKRAKCA